MRREQLFPKMINDLEIKIGVEVGVAGGLHAMNLLNQSKLEKLYCIDPYPNDCYWDTEKDGNVRYAKAQIYLDKWIKEGRAEFIRKTGLEVVDSFEDNSIGFVYLDGDRSPNVYPKEIAQWLSKIKSGGILAGHDYKNKRNFTVKTMVDDFCAKNNYTLNVSDGRCKSWWIVK